MPAITTLTSLTGATADASADVAYVVDTSANGDRKITLRDAWTACYGVPVVVDATTARTLTDADHGRLLRFTSAQAVAVSVPTALRSDFRCEIMQDGAGKVTMTGTGGATVRSKGNQQATGGQYHLLTLAKVATNEFRLWGDTVAN